MAKIVFLTAVAIAMLIVLGNTILNKDGEEKMKVATEYFSYQQAMKYLGFKSPITLREYIQSGLPIIKIGKSKRISKSDIDKFMADHRVIATQDEGGENHD